MSAIKEYFFQLICCGFLISLMGTLVHNPRVKRIICLGGGCLILLTAVRPLLAVDLESLPDRLSGIDYPAVITQEEAKERNDRLLADLVQQQTQQRITAEAERLSAPLTAEVQVARDPETGLFLPKAVTLTGSCTREQRERLAEYLEQELNLPPGSQIWRLE